MILCQTHLCFSVFLLSLPYSCFAMSTNSCIIDSPSIKEERKEFQNLLQKGSTVIIANLTIKNSETEVYPLYQRSHRWFWIANENRFLLNYPHDADVYSFGLLNVKKAIIDLQIKVENTTSDCDENFDVYLIQYFTKIAQGNDTVTDNFFTDSNGHFCYSKFEFDSISEYLSNISGVKFGLPYFCYSKQKNIFEKVEKSYVNYLIIFIIFFLYSFYQLPLEMIFFVEDTKRDNGYYYFSDSPYGMSVIFKKLIFAGDNKYFAFVRIVILILILVLPVYYLKSEIHKSCSCSFELWTNFDIFPYAENFYKEDNLFIFHSFIGGLFFLLVHICIIANSNAKQRRILDHFILLKHISLETLSVWDFHEIDECDSVSDKIKKISSVFSFQFWSQIYSLNYPTSVKKLDIKWIIFCIPPFLINVVLVLYSTFCPVISTICVGFIRIAEQLCKLNPNPTNKDGRSNDTCQIIKEQLIRWISLIFALAFLTFVFLFSFNFFFNGISYLVQFIIFTLYLAVPRLPLQNYIYVIFFTSAILYTFRFIYQFVGIYRKLLETILNIQDNNCRKIDIKVYNRIVHKYFPLSNEIFYLFVKIISCLLFFGITFDAMQNDDYLKVRTDPNLATVISAIFLFGPPRLVEAILTADFTSRVHMKENEIKQEITTCNTDLQAGGRKNFHCGCSEFRSFTILQYIFTCLCGCLKSSAHQESDSETNQCECCVILRVYSSKAEKTKRTTYTIPSFWLREEKRSSTQTNKTAETVDQQPVTTENESAETVDQQPATTENESAETVDQQPITTENESAETVDQQPVTNENESAGTSDHRKSVTAEITSTENTRL